MTREHTEFFMRQTLSSHRTRETYKLTLLCVIPPSAFEEGCQVKLLLWKIYIKHDRKLPIQVLQNPSQEYDTEKETVFWINIHFGIKLVCEKWK